MKIKRRSFIKWLMALPVTPMLPIASGKAEGTEAEFPSNRQRWVRMNNGMVYMVHSKPDRWSLKILINGKTTAVNKL